MIKKKRSFDARAKRGTLKTGWYGMGKPFSANMPSTADSPANKIVISNVTMMNDGQE